jgi:Thioredoxin
MDNGHHGQQYGVPYIPPIALECFARQSRQLVLLRLLTPQAEPMRPVIRRVSKEFVGQLLVVQVDVTTHPHLIERFKVRITPTLLLLKHGVPVEFLVGLLPANFVFDTVRKLMGRSLRGNPLDTVCQRANNPRELNPGSARWALHSADGNGQPSTVGEAIQAWLRDTSHHRSENPMASMTKGAKQKSRRMFKRQQRACLRCDQAFMSAGPHNRLCDVCRGALAAASTPEEEHSVVFLKTSSSTGEGTLI